jgi:uncharacterized membrane protein
VSKLSFLGTCLYPPHLRRTGSIALVVGTWLTLFNQRDVIWTGQLSGWIWIKIALNYLTPFVVANLGLLSKQRERSGPKSDER